jgi:hypothetical protein
MLRYAIERFPPNGPIPNFDPLEQELLTIEVSPFIDAQPVTRSDSDTLAGRASIVVFDPDQAPKIYLE